MRNADCRAIGTDEFAELMAATGPFERKPKLAVACSGGADSMALTVLSHDWARKIGGSVTALIVDHGIRREAAAEAKGVANRLDSLSISNVVLRYAGPRITGDIQSAARQVRYELLSKWCAANSRLHLCTAHHRDDQAETVLLRLARGSGVDGLAAMAAIVETRDLRVLRPLLSVSTNRLRATLANRRIFSVEDPSNSDQAFARVRMRSLKDTLSGEGMTPRRLAATAARHARARSALESDVATLLARCLVIHPQGFAYLVAEPLNRAPEEIGLRALSRILTCVGGNIYPPRLERVERLHAWLQDGWPGGGKTLAGCRIVPRGGALLVCREPAAARDVIPAKGDVIWDGRFELRFGSRKKGEVRRLGHEGWREAVTAAPELRQSNIPVIVRPSLPALWSSKGLEAIPHLDFWRCRARSRRSNTIPICFAPRRPLVPARFTLQKGEYTLSN
jgi:tRNA(Ile)-lysidine synthase